MWWHAKTIARGQGPRKVAAIMVSPPPPWGDRLVHAETGDEWRRGELRRFLTDRRGRINPVDVGLAAGPRRRTPGLRREEVAVLAGVSDSWYQWLEQGRAVNVSEQVLDAVSRGLRLDDHERRHLYMLAGASPPRGHRQVQHEIDPVLIRLLDTWMPNPAHLLDRHWYVVAANESARLVFDSEDEHFNALLAPFLNPMFRADPEKWAELSGAPPRRSGPRCRCIPTTPPLPPSPTISPRPTRSSRSCGPPATCSHPRPRTPFWHTRPRAPCPST